MDDLLTISEAAARLRISPAAVRQLVKSGKLTHCRPTEGGRRVLVFASAVDGHIARSTVAGLMSNDEPLKWVVRRRRGVPHLA